MKIAAVTTTKRPAEARGSTDFGWLHSRHSFSFGDYHDPAHMGFRSLRVINDDVVEPGGGFGEHGHRDAEIFSYVISGQLEHKDSMGNGRVIRAGDLQYMSAGRGVAHGEFNPSATEPVHFLQIWLRPRMGGGEPRYAEKTLGADVKPDSLSLLFTGNRDAGDAAIRADADIYLGKLGAGATVEHVTRPERGVWLQVIRGDVSVEGESLTTGDGLAVEGADRLRLASEQGAEFLLFDLN